MTEFVIQRASPSTVKSAPRVLPSNILTRPIELPPMRNIKGDLPPELAPSETHDEEAHE